MQDLVSVVIPCYNCEEYLEETIESVRAQTYPDVELVLVDDGSTDGTWDIIERHSDDAICYSGPNRGASVARSTGTRLASGNYIQYLDADDRLYSTALEKRVAALESESADVAYSKYRELLPGGNTFQQGPKVDKTLEDVHPDPEIATIRQFWVPPVALTYSRRIVEKIGGWNEDLPIIQDARFLHDAAFYGGHFVKVPEVLGEYRNHEAESLSTHSQYAFTRDIWVNARQVEDRWRKRDGTLSSEQREALAKVYDHCARAFFGEDRRQFRQAAARVRRLSASVQSSKLERRMQLAKVLGYEVASFIFRKRDDIKKRIKSIIRWR
jgi:glycosyltransferase involved in cell wall biosynthesis